MARWARWPALRRVIGVLGLGFLLVGQASAATVNFVQTAVNDADGSPLAAVSSDQWLETAATYSTVTAPAVFDSYRFIYWTFSSAPGIAYRDAWGRSLNPPAVLLLEATTATAHYLPDALDSDGDGIPDWFEIEYYGSLANDADSDTDGDGLTLLQEYTDGTHPLYANSSHAGGVSTADSELITCNLANYASYTIGSDPTGIVSQTAFGPPGTGVTTPDLAANPDFAYWTLDGVRQTDAWGRALSVVTFTLATANRAIVVTLLSDDSDGDGLPDAWEQRYLGTLDNDANSDADTDGVTLAQEYAAGTNPLYADTAQAGGVSYADSASVTVNLANFKRYTLSSDPAGSVSETATVTPGTTVTSPNLTEADFAYWTLDGVRQVDAWGVALRQIRFPVTDTDRAAVATFLTGDTDGDGLPDAWEQYYLGNLSHAATDVPAGGEPNLLEIYLAGTNPLFAQSSAAGGVSYADSALTVVNLQLFDALSQVQVGGTLSAVYSPNPHFVTGWNFGPHAAPAVGDWNGDGTTDLFVVSANALWVLENTGSPAAPSFKLASNSAFANFAAVCASVTHPVLALGDWSGDGRADLVLGGQTGTLRGFLASGTFASGQPATVAFTLNTGSTAAIPALGDVNGDGRPDLLVWLADGSVRTYLNTGNPATPFSGTPVSNWLPSLVPDATGLSIGDLDGDGVPDVVVADNTGHLWEFHRTGSTYLLKSKVWAGTGAGFAEGLTVALVDLNGDGNSDALVGTAQGGLVALRDPRIGAPTGLDVKRGGQSLTLTWDPNQQSRIRGYSIYRRTDTQTDFTKLLADPLPVNHYLDELLTRGTTYSYYVTSVAATYLPGNSIPKLVESPGSATVSQSPGKAKVTVHPKYEHGSRRLHAQIAIESTRELRGGDMDFHLHYNKDVLTPLSRVEAGEKTVTKSGLGKNLTVVDNSATADGDLHIQTTAGELGTGQGLLLDVTFKVKETAPAAASHQLILNTVAVNDTDGNPIEVELPASDKATLADSPEPGDVNGTGVVDDDSVAKLRDLVKQKDVKPTAQELEAGDMNADGKLDQNDVIMLSRLREGKKNTE